MACKFRVVKARLYSLAGLLYTSDSVLSHCSGGDAFQDLFLWTSISFPLAIIQIKVGKGNVAYSEELCWEELLTQSLDQGRQSKCGIFRRTVLGRASYTKPKSRSAKQMWHIQKNCAGKSFLQKA